MQVREIMSPNPNTVTLDTPVADAFQIMKERNIRRLPVVEKGKLVGIVTMKELWESSPSRATTLSIFEINYLLSKTKVKDILPKGQKVITIEADTQIEIVASIMKDNKIGGIPVMEKGKLVGIVTETDIFGSFIDILGVKRRGTRIDLEIDDRPGVLAEVSGLIADFKINIQNIVSIPKKDSARVELIIRIDTREPDELVKALQDKGFNVINVMVKN